MGMVLAHVIRRIVPLLGLMLAGTACASIPQAQGQGSSSVQQIALADVHWCSSPLITFEDKQSAPPKIISDWSTIAPALHFTIYLPATLPKGSCLVTVAGAIHDTVQGNHFSISYLLPNQSPMSFLESPLSGSVKAFQCQIPQQPATTLICLGTRGQTAVLIAAKESQAQIKALFNSLTTGVTWQPTS
jgi:hypothetical protein